MESLPVWIFCAALFAYNVYLGLSHEARVEKLLDRLGSKDLAEYQYYQEKYQKDVSELEAIRKESRVVRSEEPKSDVTNVDRAFIDNCEEDWGELVPQNILDAK